VECRVGSNGEQNGGFTVVLLREGRQNAQVSIRKPSRLTSVHLTTDLNSLVHVLNRTDRAVEERISLLKAKGLYSKLSKPIRNQLEVAIEVLGQRQVNGRERVEKLREVLDA
jgi:hypothetical protein